MPPLQVSYIISELDEIEKEEFFRLKKVLKVKDKKRLEEEAEEKATMEAMLEVRPCGCAIDPNAVQFSSVQCRASDAQVSAKALTTAAARMGIDRSGFQQPSEAARFPASSLAHTLLITITPSAHCAICSHYCLAISCRPKPQQTQLWQLCLRNAQRMLQTGI